MSDDRDQENSAARCASCGRPRTDGPYAYCAHCGADPAAFRGRPGNKVAGGIVFGLIAGTIVFLYSSGPLFLGRPDPDPGCSPYALRLLITTATLTLLALGGLAMSVTGQFFSLRVPTALRQFLAGFCGVQLVPFVPCNLNIAFGAGLERCFQHAT